MEKWAQNFFFLVSRKCYKIWHNIPKTAMFSQNIRPHCHEMASAKKTSKTEKKRKEEIASERACRTTAWGKSEQEFPAKLLRMASTPDPPTVFLADI